ncbi:MAG TPA: NADH-quinone oxidoreductase subunit C [Bacteroidia bacterium]|nr:NADH-quinone oxidoreductase subunit C [Bacteroidia bacterium]
MNKDELKIQLGESPAYLGFDESAEHLCVQIPPEELLNVMRQLRDREDLKLDYLYCMTCVDWKDHLMMVYMLRSVAHGIHLNVKVKLSDIANPEIESLTGLWKTAELNENEIFDLFGVKFTHHPNLRRMFLEPDWKGYPLRKNYEDENMIKL